MTKLITPTISLHGSSKETLVEDHLRVVRALDEALQRMAFCVPHGRDYPSNERLYEAQDAWKARRVQLKQLRDEIELLTFNIDQQGR